MTEPLQIAIRDLSGTASALSAGLRATLDQLDGMPLDDVRLTGGQLASAAVHLGEASRLVAGANGGGAPLAIYLDDQTGAQIAGIRQKAIEITAQFQKLDSLIEQHTAELNARVERIVDDLAEAREDIGRWAESVGEQLAAASSAVDEPVRNAVDDAADELNARREALQALIEERLLSQPVELVGDLVKDLTDWMQNTQDILANAADQLQSESTGAVKELTNDALDEAREAVEKKVCEIMEQVLRELAADVVESTALSQVGISLTSALSPVLPQLIAAKLLLGEIKSLLEAMRMGT